jgi:hypothetical protein
MYDEQAFIKLNINTLINVLIERLQELPKEESEKIIKETIEKLKNLCIK